MPPEPITFAADLYSVEAVRATAEAFSGLATIRVDVPESGAVATVVFDDVREDVADAIVDEFCNHALAGTVERRRASAV